MSAIARVIPQAAAASGWVQIHTEYSCLERDHLSEQMSSALVPILAKELMGKIPYLDLTVQFIGAYGLPKVDLIGPPNPYFVARLDNTSAFVSTVKSRTVCPVWNELWKMKNVPVTTTLYVEVWYKSDLKDCFIARFSTTISSGVKEIVMQGLVLKGPKGSFWLKIESTPSTCPNPQMCPFLFDGPVRISSHSSPTIGRLTKINDRRIYTTWKIHIKGVRSSFGDQVQPWNRSYRAAQSIFQGPGSIALRATIQAGHRMLYSRSTTNDFGVIESKDEMFNIFRQGKKEMSADCRSIVHRIKPAVYTYIIAFGDDSFRFSETGAAFFVDFASKHALHSSCAEVVRYAGEFHLRPKGGWKNFHDEISDDQVEWEFVVDNNSGTYSPDPKLLPKLKECLEYNFPGFDIVAFDHKDPALKESTDACRAYALNNRGIDNNELQPHVHYASEGEVTLMQQTSVEMDMQQEDAQISLEEY